MTWITRGQKPDRIAEAFAVGAVEGLLKGVVQGDTNALWRAGVTGVAAAVANNPHRIKERVQRKRSFDRLIQEAFDGDKTPAAGAASRPALSHRGETVGFKEICRRVQSVRASCGSDQIVVQMPIYIWLQLSTLEKSFLRASINANLSISLEYTSLDMRPFQQVG